MSALELAYLVENIRKGLETLILISKCYERGLHQMKQSGWTDTGCKLG